MNNVKLANLNAYRNFMVSSTKVGFMQIKGKAVIISLHLIVDRKTLRHGFQI